ncbi:MAG: hypothetical protein V4850_32485 [Myxococcota bacterium]
MSRSSRSVSLFASSLLIYGLVPAAHASTVEVLSTPAFLEPTTGKTPGDKDGCPPVSSNADPEEGTLHARIVVTATIIDPNVLVVDTNNPGTDSIDDLTLDDPTTGTASTAGVVRDLDYLDGLDDGQLAPGTYDVYFNLDKTDYVQGATPTTSTNCAGRSFTNDREKYTLTLRSGTTAVAGATDDLTVVMLGSAGVKQNDLDWLDTAPDSIGLAPGGEFCIRSKYRQSSAQGLFELIGNAFYNANVLRLDHVNLFYYDTNGADPGSIATGIPGVTAPGVTPEDTFFDQVYFDAAALDSLGNGGDDLSSGDHWVSEFCFTVVGSGSTFFSPYWVTRASSTSNYKVDSGFGEAVVLNPASLTILKECDPAEAVVAGAETMLTHSLTVCNEGAGDAADVIVVDTLPVEEVECVSAESGDATIPDGVCDNVAHTVTWEIGTLAAGECVDLPFVVAVTADGDPNPALTNDGATASGVGAETGTEVSADTAETCPYDVLVPSFTVDKEANAEVFSPGETVTYSITVTNTGTVDLENLAVSDDVDEASFQEFGAISDGGVFAAGLITWTVPSLLAGESIVLTYDAVLLAAGAFDPADCVGTFNDVLNNVTVESDFGIEEDSETICVAAAPLLTITKVANGTTPVEVTVANSASADSAETAPVQASAEAVTAVGATDVAYTITVSNTGDAAASAVVVQDVLQSVTFQSATPAPSTQVAGTLTWQIGTLGVGASAEIDLTVRAE